MISYWESFRTEDTKVKKSLSKLAQTFSSHLFVYVMACALTLASTQSFAQEDSPESIEAGRVIFANGNVVAVGTAGNTRELSRRSPVFVGDTIFTDIESSAQIRMADAALIALKELTEFSIVAYQYDENPETDISAIELLQGGFRTITSAIGEQNRSSYSARIRELASFGIRGTDYEVVITLDGEIISGVYDGDTTFSNDIGALDLGLGADFDFGIVRNATTPPEGLLVQPGELGIVLQSIVSNDTDDDRDDDGSDPDGATGDEDSDDDGDDSADRNASIADNSQDDSDTERQDNADDSSNDDDSNGILASARPEQPDVDNDSSATTDGADSNDTRNLALSFAGNSNDSLLDSGSS